MVSNLLNLWWVVSISLIILVTACSQVKPEFTRDYLPISYRHGEAQDWKLVLLNGSHQLNRRVIRFWLENSYRNLYRQQHPVIPLTRENLRELSIFLNQTVYIYYIFWPSSSVVVSFAKLRKRLPCSPLSNIEIRFLFTGTGEQPFSSNGLTLLFISAHELLQQLGWTPEYPQLLNNRLRSARGLKPLKTMDSFNIFATGKTSGSSSQIAPGLIICRRGDQSEIEIKNKKQ